jgi:hypothetical protein
MDPIFGMDNKSGSGSGMNNPDHISESGSGIHNEKIRIRDPVMEKSGSGIRLWKNFGSGIRHGKNPNPRSGYQKTSDPGSGINPQHWL